VVSDTQHDEAVQVADMEDEHDRDRREARELAYHEVSLRAVELLANAQRAADEAVAEAQSYARDLEETAREQYRHILQRAHDAARTTTGEPAGDGETAETAEAAGGGAVGIDAAAPTSGGGLDGRELEYVRTYARVAHSQLKAVLGALTDELDRLADLADGSAPSPADVASGPHTVGSSPNAADSAPEEQHGEGPPTGR
jgi:hypothetical protein